MRAIISIAVAAVALMFMPGIAEAQTMKYKAFVNVKVGQSMLILGVRSQTCGAAPEAFSQIRSALPKSNLGTFSDGGLGTTRSSRCGKIVPARGLVFTARKVGTEAFTFRGDRFKITVK